MLSLAIVSAAIAAVYVSVEIEGAIGMCILTAVYHHHHHFVTIIIITVTSS